MSDIMDETSSIFLNFTHQLHESFLKDFHNRHAVVYQATIWAHFIFVYDVGEDIPTRNIVAPSQVGKWIHALGSSIQPIRYGVYVTSDKEAGAFKGFYPDLLWSGVDSLPKGSKKEETIIRIVKDLPKTTMLAAEEANVPEVITSRSVGTQGKLFDL